MRLSLFLLIWLAIVSDGQDAGSTEPIRAKLKKGTTTGRLIVPISKTPAPGDRLVIGSDTNVLKVSLITPDGRRVTSVNAAANAFDWSESPDTPPIGSTDGGFHAIVAFKGAAATGNYTIDFASAALRKQAGVEAWYVTDRDQYDQVFRQLPGAQRAGPVFFDSSKRTQDLTLSLAADESGTLIDILVSDPNTTASLKLPNGTIVTPQTPKTDDLEWRTVTSADQVDPPGAIVGIGGFLLPRDGTHHVIMFRAAAKGDYIVHLELSGSNPGQAEAMILPLERTLTELTAEIGKPPKLPDGTILLQPMTLPYDCFVGDKLDLGVRLIGDPVKDAVRFQVKVEIRTPLPYKEGAGQEYASPKVVVTPVAFRLGPDGWYHGVLVPREHGAMRVSVTASGTSAAGKRFKAQTMLTNVMVAPVVATLVSLTERAIDDDGNGRPDRWELTATLDVAMPGKYEMRFDLSGAEGDGIGGDANGTLSAGRQRLTASVPAVKMFDNLKDGPYAVRVHLFRPEGNSFGTDVPVAPLQTPAYRHDQWDRGKVYGEEKVELKPIRPGKTGKFTAVEVTWQAVTQGGGCNWSGDLRFDNQFLQLMESGEDFPRGASRFTFEFDAAALATAKKGEGYFSGAVTCGDGSGRPASARAPITFDPSQFEPADSALRVLSPRMARVVIGQQYGSGLAQLEVQPRPRDNSVYRVTRAPAGLSTTLRGDLLQITASNNIEPGRYYIDVEATVGAEKAMGVVIVDAVQPLPHVPPRKYTASPPTAHGIRPNKRGKFQNLEVLWPVDIPGGDCKWRGSMYLDGAPEGVSLASGSSGALAPGRITLSLILDGGAIGNAMKSDWTFQSHIDCDNTGREAGASAAATFTLPPADFAKEVDLQISSTTRLRLTPGGFGSTVLSVKTNSGDPALFEFVSLPAGFRVTMELAAVAGAKSVLAKVFTDDNVRFGRYHLPVTVTVGTKRGTADVVVDVLPY